MSDDLDTTRLTRHPIFGRRSDQSPAVSAEDNGPIGIGGCFFGVNGSEIEALAISMYPEPLVRAWQSLMAVDARLGVDVDGFRLSVL